jgi:hypothetical protein
MPAAFIPRSINIGLTTQGVCLDLVSAEGLTSRAVTMPFHGRVRDRCFQLVHTIETITWQQPIRQSPVSIHSTPLAHPMCGAFVAHVAMKASGGRK